MNTKMSLQRFLVGMRDHYGMQKEGRQWYKAIFECFNG